jgi:serine/threonine protein kinase
MSTCPSHETLARLGHDSLDGAAWAAVEAHVQHCAECVGSLEKLAAHGTATAPASASLPPEDSLPRIPGFDIEAELGRGGMGAVYRAWEPKLTRTVALKVVASGPMASARERKRWLLEARCVTRVRHPNIVHIHDAAEAGGWLYLVLEFVPGGSLKERLREPLPPRAAAELLRLVAQAMSAVHEAGLLHLDLKPSNILLDSAPDAPWKDASPKVADFGIARPLADLNASSTSLAGPWGTPSYMAPELATASRIGIGPAADIHSLGAILYELLTGRPPFHGSSALDTLDQLRSQNPVPPRRMNPKIPRDLETIALKCLEKNPSRRYATAEMLADDLDCFLQGRPIKAKPVSTIGRAWRWCRRQPVIAALAVTLFLTVIGGFLGLLMLLHRSETERARSEANYQVASRSLDEITRILTDELMDEPLKYEGPNSRKALEIAHAQEIELSKRYPLDIAGVKRLATISALLAHFYSRDGKREEARSLVQEAIGHSDAYLAVSPGDADLQHRLFELAVCLLIDLVRSENDRLYDQCNARATALLERLNSLPDRHVADLCQLSAYHRFRADYLMLRGETGLACKELERDLDLVRSVPVAETAYRELVFSEMLTVAALGRWSGELTPLERSIRSRPANIDVKPLEACLAELTARRIGLLPSIDSSDQSSRFVSEGLPTETWTDRAVSVIQADAAKFDLDHNHLPAICWRMKSLYWHTLWQQRQAGNLAEAQRIVDRLLALAGRMTRSYPDQAAAYMLLSEVYVQRAKNAYRVRGEPVDGWERKALEAAIQATTLEPENAEVHNLVKNRRARLDKLASK